MGLVLDAKSERLYESWAHSPDSIAFERIVEQAIRTMLDPRPGETVLDIGCGEGKHLLFFRNMGLGTSGIDASPHMIRKASERLGGRSELRVGWAEDLPYDDNQFDLAVLINTLEFVDHPLETLREAGRVARRKVFICVINSFSWLCLFSKIKGIYRDSLLSRLKAFNIWKLQSLARSAFGDAPMEWTCIRLKSNIISQDNHPGGIWNSAHLPFGFFLGLAVSPYYSLRVAQHPLLVRGKARGSLVKGITTRVSAFPSTAVNGRKTSHEDQATE
jgi:ubiquinone/menaquinone biosynthesis C-methylase UbiE